MTEPLIAAEQAWRLAGVDVERRDNALIVAEHALLEIYSDDPLTDWGRAAEGLPGADWSVCAVVPGRLVGATRDALRDALPNARTGVQAWWREDGDVRFGSVESA